MTNLLARNSQVLSCLFSVALMPFVCAGAATAQDALKGEGAPYSQTFFFGDAMTDSGFYRPLLPSSVRPLTGQFTTNPGWVWSQDFADYYGTLAAPNGNGQANPDALYALSGGYYPAPVVILDPEASAAAMLGLTPRPVTDGSAAAISAGIEACNNALFSAPAPRSAQIIPIDLLTFSRELHAEAAAFGFTNTTGTACQPQITANSLTCNPTSIVD